MIDFLPENELGDFNMDNKDLLLVLIGVLMLLVAIKKLFSSITQVSQDINPNANEELSYDLRYKQIYYIISFQREVKKWKRL